MKFCIFKSFDFNQGLWLRPDFLEKWQSLYKGTEQPLQGMELQLKKEENEEKHI